MSQEITIGTDLKVKKRNGQLVPFNAVRISNAVSNAFKQSKNLPREAELSDETIKDVEKITSRVIAALKEQAFNKESLSVEEIQDEVICQLFENDFKEIGRLYSDYRKKHAVRRSLFELYKTIKRDGRVVAFKPEKITLAVVKAFRAYYNTELTEALREKAHQITGAVTADIQKQWPQGRTIHIEEIQDLVERALMAARLHDVAKNYILYRKERAKARQTPITDLGISLDWAKNIMVKTDLGEEKPLNLNSLRFMIESCCSGIESISADKIFTETVKNYYNGITEDKISMANILVASSFTEVEPNYAFVAARLLLLREYKEALEQEVSFEGIKIEYATYFPEYIKKTVDLELLSPDLLKFDLELLGNSLESKRDFLFRYMGLQTLYDRYFIHWDGRRIELPQVFWMRVAMGLAKNEGAQINQRAIEFYNILSTFRFTSSTPTLFNSGTKHSQLSSCFLTTVED